MDIKNDIGIKRFRTRQPRYCLHLKCEAFYVSSKKDWRGYYRCFNCKTVFYSEDLKNYLKNND
jgi:hypothetical protein